MQVEQHIFKNLILHDTPVIILKPRKFKFFDTYTEKLLCRFDILFL